ncbi:hypothetical protein BKH46_02490 [Helicobacter sp. 12S02634-8]|uniref:phage portal protein family protein n=1 Tax=Helicobacter sp. 12S02634-8 TaxID=1476199 RepID=UPI000BA64AE0|nr:DUF935 family protein [Helicobacter sp. 12S02634-8]PAF47724.1 hypothetical protein BKH46_02490 [Helicobacter sp. 12S02634-8]
MNPKTPKPPKLSNLDLNPRYKNAIPAVVPYERIKGALQSDNIADLLGIYAHFLRFDAQISSEFQKRRISLSRLPFMVESEDKTQQAFLEKLCAQAHFRRFLFDASSAIAYGFAPFILNWDLKDNQVFPSLSYISTKFISSKEDRLYISMGSNQVFLDEREDIWVHFHPTDSGELIYQGLFYKVISIASLKYIALSKYMNYLDSLSIPPLVVKTEDISNEQDIEKMMEMLFNLRSNSVGIFDKNSVFELLNGNVDKGTFLEFIQYCDEAISKVITGQVLAGNSTQNGTQALGNIHDKIRKNTEEYDAALLSESIKGLLDKALKLNFSTPAPFSFEMDTNTETDENEQMEVFVKLKQIGVDVPIEHLEQTFKIKGLKRFESLSDGDGGDYDNRSQSLAYNARDDKKEGTLEKTLKTYALDKPLSDLEVSDKALQASTEDTRSKVLEIVEKSESFESAYNEILRAFKGVMIGVAEDVLFELIGNAALKGELEGSEGGEY